MKIYSSSNLGKEKEVATLIAVFLTIAGSASLPGYK